MADPELHRTPADVPAYIWMNALTKGIYVYVLAGPHIFMQHRPKAPGRGQERETFRTGWVVHPDAARRCGAPSRGWIAHPCCGCGTGDSKKYSAKADAHSCAHKDLKCYNMYTYREYHTARTYVPLYSYICMYVYIYIYMCLFIYIYIYIHTHVHALSSFIWYMSMYMNMAMFWYADTARCYM